MARYSYSSLIAGRTRVARFVQDTPELLEHFLALGGLPNDLETVITKGEEAKHHNVGQSEAYGVGLGATGEVQAAFSALQRDYKAVMRVVRAVRQDLEDTGASAEVLEPIDRILADETAVHIKTVKGEGDSALKKALKSRSQEDIRIEIEKDALALLGNTALTDKLAARRVDGTRLTTLHDGAVALNGKLAHRVAKKAERKTATAAEHAAVRAQSRRWAVLYPLLAAIDDIRVEELLATIR